MKLLVAPAKFKGCLTGPQVAAAIGAGARRADPAALVDLCPVADGGEGFVEALVAATGGRLETRRVTGPLPDMRVDATFGILGDQKTAVVEMAAASGLALLAPEDRDPLRTTTFGTGELLLHAAKLGVSEILLGIGGSATVDGGIGAAQACGQPVILDRQGAADTAEPLVGEDLERVVLVKHARGSPLDRVKITVACDVTNPLFGPTGAAAVYGPQKGATPEQVERLDALLKQLAERCGKMPEASAPGAGAAGGLGFAMLAFFGATLRPGFDIVADATRLRDRLRGVDLCLTGEGRLDGSSLHGKATAGVARLCRDAGVPCVALAGSVAREELREQDDPFTAAFSVCPGPITLEDAQRNATALLAAAAENVLRLFRHGRP
jgi:glycerate kinase